MGINARGISSHIRRFLSEKYGEQCSSCGWNQRHTITGKVPLEVDHVDGNSENNKEENLRLLCPNCHSLTPCFRNLNKGKGRSWRLKYLKRLQANQTI
ncbi:HNH endonuclease [Candidatus Daviesbacteria bacterium]|nr:HNH endonuclease [Candidatus Daviesbacteria bacterium]